MSYSHQVKRLINITIILNTGRRCTSIQCFHCFVFIEFTKKFKPSGNLITFHLVVWIVFFWTLTSDMYVMIFSRSWNVADIPQLIFMFKHFLNVTRFCSIFTVVIIIIITHTGSIFSTIQVLLVQYV